MTNRLGRRARLLAVVAGCSALVAACGSTSTSKSSTGSSGSGGSGAVPVVKLDPAAAAQLPAKFKASKVINVAADASYSPNEFFASDNKTIIGMDVDLAHALGQALGVTFTFQNEKFDSILGSLGTRFDLGISSFTDTKAREQQVDMVDYFSAGTSFMVASGKNQGLTSLAALCGKSVAVETGTTQLDDASGQSKKCTASGHPGVAVNSFPDQNGANLALSSGRVAVVMADSPVNAYAAKQSNGAFQIVGQPYGTAPYGIAVAKGAGYSGMPEALKTALGDLQTSGAYGQILKKWGVQSGAVNTFSIDGASS